MAYKTAATRRSAANRRDLPRTGPADRHGDRQPASRGVQPGNVVALYSPRSPEQTTSSPAPFCRIWVPVDINRRRSAPSPAENCRPTLVVHGGDLETPIGVTPATY
ncbi:hypothetical protein M8494_35780 [Serratia ureilytica]